MGRTPCCKAEDVKRGQWTSEEDKKLRDYIQENGGHGSWRLLPARAGLNRCGKSCRLRWTNYLRPDIKRGSFSEEEERLIIDLHSVLGNKWSSIAGRLPGRTDNEIKNYWNTHLRKKLQHDGIDPVTHRPRTYLGFLANLPSLLIAANLRNLTNPWNINALQRQEEVEQMLKLQLASNLIHLLAASGSSTATPSMDKLTALFGSPARLIGGYQPRDLQLRGLVQGSPYLNSQSPISMASGTYVSCPNSELLASLSVEQPAAALGCCSSDNSGIEMSSGSACTRSSALPASDTSAPSLASGSPEILQPVEQINPGDCSTSKDCPLTLFETWDTFDQYSDDFSWEEMLEQMSGPDASSCRF